MLTTHQWQPYQVKSLNVEVWHCCSHSLALFRSLVGDKFLSMLILISDCQILSHFSVLVISV